MSEQNQAILLTPAGSGAIAVVRIVGTAVDDFLSKHFSKPAAAGRCVHGDLCDASGAVLDDIVVVSLADRNGADLNLHGGPWVVESVLALLQSNGFTVCSRAPLELLDGEDVFEREMLASLPSARTEAAVRVLLAQPELWRAYLAMTPTPESIEAVLSDKSLWWMLNPARVAIVGLPNVGKSTLANQLFGQQRSITADLPGTTRDWVGEFADVDGVPIVLIDTPGLRDSADAIEQSAIALSRPIVENADLAVVVIDPTQELTEQTKLAGSFQNRIVVLNKFDRVKDMGKAPMLRQDVSTIATTGEGIADLRHLIRQKLGCDDLTTKRPRWWTQRQRDYLAGSKTSN